MYMPEGPEVWILSKAINSFFSDDNTMSVGKHLIVKDCMENWSFGLNGKVKLSKYNELTKLSDGWINGDAVVYDNLADTIKNIGLDWMTASKEDIAKEIDTWKKSSKQLAGLMLDQSKICGIGVAWGSEILFKAGVQPNVKARDQDLCNLVQSIIDVRETIQETYDAELIKTIELSNAFGYDNLKLRQFINNWFTNLYEIRTMDIYKKGAKVLVLGRSWWV